MLDARSTGTAMTPGGMPMSGEMTMSDEMTTTEDPESAVLAQIALPPPVADYGPVRLELMGHRYREGRLSEVVIAGTPFLRLDLEGGGAEYYRPDAVYCITPGIALPPPLAAIPQRFGALADDDYDEADWTDSEDDGEGDNG
jgi:hypothetical protein